MCSIWEGQRGAAGSHSESQLLHWYCSVHYFCIHQTDYVTLITQWYRVRTFQSGPLFALESDSQSACVIGADQISELTFRLQTHQWWKSSADTLTAVGAKKGLKKKDSVRLPHHTGEAFFVFRLMFQLQSILQSPHSQKVGGSIPLSWVCVFYPCLCTWYQNVAPVDSCI